MAEYSPGAEPRPESPAAADTLESLLAARYSCRAFRGEKVDRTIIERILQMAQRTASWCNAQPWQVIVTAGPATERFRQAYLAFAASNAPATDLPFPREYRGVHLQRRRESGLQLYRSVGIERADLEGRRRQERENFRLFGAPHVAIVTTDEALGVYGAIDCGAWVSNFMLAAQSLGVASIAQGALAAHSGFVRRFFGLGEDRRVVCGVSFGYEDTAHPANGFRTSRAPLGEVVSWVGSD
ncbi:MAG: nitroreductase [Burkholderiales bacterium]|nr:nitroreductase [Burkholderiales bacterium]OJX06624.1 MAG: nitroreductase [Burkholderiales bacterium 70-64]